MEIIDKEKLILSVKGVFFLEDLISVIIPVYKVESYLNKCIKSVVNQTYRNLEILLIDDGSPDRCPQICDQWAREDSRIIVFHKENGGLSDARNYGLDRATGRYIAFVDSDDYIHKDMYQIMYQTMHIYKCDIVEVDYNRLTANEENNAQVQIKLVPENIFVRDKKEAFSQMILDIKSKSYAWNKLYKSTLWNNIRFPKGKLFEDILTTYKLIILSSKVVKLDAPLYNYIIRNGSIVSTIFNIKTILAHYEASSALFDFVKKNYEELMPIVCIRFFSDSFEDLYKVYQIRHELSDFKYYIQKIVDNLYKYSSILSNSKKFNHAIRVYSYENRILFSRKRKRMLIKFMLLRCSFLLLINFIKLAPYLNFKNILLKFTFRWENER